VKRLAIINPASRCGRTGKACGDILRWVRKIGADYRFTEARNDARAIALAAREYDCLIAVGGDGTVFEILQGIDLSRQLLAVVPAGTGNSLSRDLGIPTISAGFSIAADGHTRSIDLLEATVVSRDGGSSVYLAASTLAIGYVAEVVALANNAFKRLGMFCYPAAALVQSIKQKRPFIRITNNCQSEPAAVEKQLTGLMISNTRFAANFEAFPEGKIDDGEYEIMELNAGFFRQNLHNISVLSRLHWYRPVSVRKTCSVSVRPAMPCDLLIDGEIVSAVESFEITSKRGALQCIIPL
jgi:diacylglycerol kinase family enzyme